MISVAEASARIEASVIVLADEEVALEAAAGRVLRQSVIAERDQPPFDRVMMDGIAVSSANSARRLSIAGTAYAGDRPVALPHAAQCIEVMTGAVLPSGCDAVVALEDIEIDGAEVIVKQSATIRPGQYVHRRASDHCQGTALLHSGILLGANEIAVIASAGLARVAVGRIPRTAVVATGDELVAPGAPVEPHQVRLSNGPAIAAALKLHGLPAVTQHHLVDSRPELRESLAGILSGCDVLVLSGGVSMGRADHVPAVLDSLGVRCVFHRVAQRPGKPLWFGVHASGRMVFGLPGNPVSALTCLRRYVLPAMLRASGLTRQRDETIRLANRIDSPAALTAFLPAIIESRGDGPVAKTVTINTSGDFTALAGTDGLVELGAERSVFDQGDTVPFYRW